MRDVDRIDQRHGPAAAVQLLGSTSNIVISM
jgi:hypothetical protein